MMRIRRIEIAAFGGLEDRSTGSAPLDGFVVVEGRNEAGKSSVFEFLCSVLYGIYPTAAERHPFAPWSGAELAGTARIALGEGAEIEVTRRLLSTPAGTVSQNGRTDHIRNDDLPFVAHVPLKVFRQVYAIGLSELARLDDEGWAAIEDRILGRLGATDLRPAREVAAELDDAARALWRPDRRGNPRVRQLDEAIREVAGRRPGVRARTEERRRAADRLAELRQVLASARTTREADQARLERLRRLVPVRRERTRIDELRRRAGPEPRRSGLPADPVAELERRRERLEIVRREVKVARDEQAALAVDLEAFTDDDRALLDREAELETFRARAAGAEPLRTRLAGVEQDLRGIERRLLDESDRLPWSGAAEPSRLGTLAAAPLAEAWTRWLETRRRLETVGAAAPPEVDASTPDLLGRVATATLALALVALIAAGLAILGVPPFDAVPGAAAAVGLVSGVVLGAVGGVLRTLRRRERAGRFRAVEARTDADRSAREAERRARGAVNALLAPAGLAVPDEPDPELPARVDRCRQWIRDRDDLAAVAHRLRADLDEVDEQALRLAPLGGGGLGAAAAATLLQERLKEARDRAATARRAEARASRLTQVLDEAEGRLRAAADELKALEDQLTAFDADPATGAEVAARCLDAAREAERRWEELRVDHPDLDEVLAEIDRAEAEGAPWLTEADPIGALQDELAARTADIESWVADARELESRTVASDDEETLDELEGELRRLRDLRDRARRDHDRFHILARLVSEADREVRDLHQPEILRLAGRHLEVLTGGRYDRLDIAEDGSRALRVSGPALPGGLAVGRPLSTGTREQIYLALRLALVRHLDEGGERLPLFLDEILVNWDPERRERGLDLLERTATERQVFLFTCHPDLADAAVARGARRWRLDPP